MQTDLLISLPGREINATVPPLQKVFTYATTRIRSMRDLLDDLVQLHCERTSGSIKCGCAACQAYSKLPREYPQHIDDEGRARFVLKALERACLELREDFLDHTAKLDGITSCKCPRCAAYRIGASIPYNDHIGGVA